MKYSEYKKVSPEEIRGWDRKKKIKTAIDVSNLINKRIKSIKKSGLYNAYLDEALGYLTEIKATKTTGKYKNKTTTLITTQKAFDELSDEDLQKVMSWQRHLMQTGDYPVTISGTKADLLKLFKGMFMANGGNPDKYTDKQLIKMMKDMGGYEVFSNYLKIATKWKHDNSGEGGLTEWFYKKSSSGVVIRGGRRVWDILKSGKKLTYKAFDKAMRDYRNKLEESYTDGTFY